MITISSTFKERDNFILEGASDNAAQAKKDVMRESQQNQMMTEKIKILEKINKEDKNKALVEKKNAEDENIKLQK